MKHSFQSLVLIGALSVATLAPATPAVALQAATTTADAELTAKVKAQIEAEAEFKGSEITVTTSSSVVTLTGAVPSPLVRAKVGELTKATAGVSKVNNKLTLSRATKEPR